MSLRTYLVVALALVFGLSAALGIGLFVRNPATVQAAETVAIVVARTDVSRFVPITELNLEMKEVAKNQVPPGALTSIADAIDRAAYIDVSKQDYILDQMLTKKGSKTVASAIPRGKCAFHVQNSNAPGFIQPGDRVDVLFTYKEKSGAVKSATVLSMVDVMAVNGSMIPTLDPKTDGKEPNNVTLLLTQEEAREMEEGQKLGTIRLTLRNIGDLQPVATTKLSELKIGAEPEKKETPVAVAPPPPPPPPAPIHIRTLNGTVGGVVTLEPAIATVRPAKE